MPDPLATEILTVLADLRSANARQIYAVIVARHPISHRVVVITLVHLVHSGVLSTRTYRRRSERRRYRVVARCMRCATT